MKSIKPGRGPSMMGGVVGIFLICFGIFWTVLAAMANGFFAIFGVLWTCAAVAMTVYHFKNATGKHRYSAYDVVDANEEPDPLNARFAASTEPEKSNAASRFCPHCGAGVEPSFKFCNHCGQKLP